MKSNLGATPIGVCPAVFSVPLNISTGAAMGILLVFFIIVQILILKKEFSPFQTLQIAATLVYSFMLDLTSNFLELLPASNLLLRVLYCLLGIIILSFGVFIMLKTDFLMLPQDAVVKVLCEKLNVEYGKVKISLDVVLTTIAAVGTLIINGKLVNVGIGTVAAAILVGKTINMIKKWKGFNSLVSCALGETQLVQAKAMWTV